jgi:hypothetical protein
MYSVLGALQEVYNTITAAKSKFRVRAGGCTLPDTFPLEGFAEHGDAFIPPGLKVVETF